MQDVLKKQVKIIYSTTISFFKDILHCVGGKSKDVKSKGGIKVHRVINPDKKVPNLVWLSPGSMNEHNFLKKLKCDGSTIYVFDKGYNDYSGFEYFSDHKTGFVTQIEGNAVYDLIDIKEVPEAVDEGMLFDKIIEI